jgi:hypothetical protein
MTRRLQTRSLPTVAMVAIAFAGVSAAYGQGSWRSLASVPAPTEGMSVGGVGQRIIAAYGFSPITGDTNQTRLYNINTNTWSFGRVAPGSPSSEEAYGDTVQDGFLYVIGGRAGFPGAPPLSDLRRYNPVTNSWAILAPMPTARAAAAAAVVDDAIFVIGGRTSTGGPCSGGPLSVVERYDIDQNTWTAVAPLPSPRSDLAAVERGGKVFVFGGCSGIFSDFTDQVDMYDPETNTWTPRRSMPTPRASLVVGHRGDNVYAIGGWNGGPPLNVNEVYKMANNSWTTAAPMPTARGEAGAHSHGGRVYVVGGSQPAFGASTDVNEVFKPKP